MLFNSYSFLLCFLPITLTLIYLFSYFRHLRTALWTGAIASLVFYGLGSSEFLPILIASAIINYTNPPINLYTHFISCICIRSQTYRSI